MPEHPKQDLEAIYRSLNPAELHRQIAGCQDRLMELLKTKKQRRKVERPRSIPRPAPWQDPRAKDRYADVFREATDGRFEDILTSGNMPLSLGPVRSSG